MPRIFLALPSPASPLPETKLKVESRSEECEEVGKEEGDSLSRFPSTHQEREIRQERLHRHIHIPCLLHGYSKFVGKLSFYNFPYLLTITMTVCEF
jgi:hypothetical protein